MTIEDITALLRTGDLRLAVRSADVQRDGNYGLTMSGEPSLFTPEFLQAIDACQKVLLVRLIRSDVRICLAPDEHRAEYLFHADPFGVSKVFTCPLCATLREEQAKTLPPVEDCIQRYSEDWPGQKTPVV